MKRLELEAHVLVLVTLALVAFGLVMVYSATSAPAALGNGDPSSYLKRQAVYAVIGLVLLLVASRIHFRALRALAPALLGVGFALCVAVLVLGTPINGARRWLTAGPATFQPSELAKLGIAVWAAAYLSRRPAPATVSPSRTPAAGLGPWPDRGRSTGNGRGRSRYRPRRRLRDPCRA